MFGSLWVCKGACVGEGVSVKVCVWVGCLDQPAPWLCLFQSPHWWSGVFSGCPDGVDEN